MKRTLSAGFLLLLLLVQGALVIPPAAAQSGVTWNGKYFNTAYLSNDVLTRQDSAIAFDWGAGSPDASVHSDNFSVRWGADVYFPAGTYRFWAVADDHVRVSVDFPFKPQIDTWSSGQVNQTVSADIPLSAGTHHIQVDYQELSGDARVFVTWANLATNPSSPNFPAPIPQPVPVSSGPWTAQYYSNQSLAGNPTVIVSENNPTHDWGSGAPFSNMPSDNFSARWTSVQSLAGGTYRITVKVDDGVRVFVDGQQFINEWHAANGATYAVDVNLYAGQHNFMIEYYEASGKAFLNYTLSQISGYPPYTPPTATPPIVYPSYPPGNVGYGNWLATYFNNRSLAGTPSAILTEASPAHNWGSGAAVPSVGLDNWSARWTSIQTFSAGTYRVSARADDGVRVYVDGTLLINEWHDAIGRTYTGDINLAAGAHNVTVEFYEATGLAFLEFNIGPVSQSGGGSTGGGSASGYATVNAYRLNVRQQPTTGSAVLMKITQGATYPIVGCNTDRSWWQINVNGTYGWVFATFVDVANASCTASAPGQQPQLPGTGYSATALTTVNVRSQPSTRGAILGTLRSGQSALVVGRNSSATWWQINFNNTVGWVSAAYARVPFGADLGQIPVR